MIFMPHKGPEIAYKDNQPALCNIQVPELVLKKRSHSIARYLAIEGAARRKWIVACANNTYNEDNLLEKALHSGKNRNIFVRKHFIKF